MQIASLALEALRADEILVGQEAPRALRLIGVRAEKLARAEDGCNKPSSTPSRAGQTHAPPEPLPPEPPQHNEVAGEWTIARRTVLARELALTRGLVPAS